MRPITVTVGPLATASATNISASQAVPGATAIVLDGTTTAGYSATAIATTTGNGAATTTVTLNGATVQTINGATVAYLATPAQVVLVSAGNDSGKTWTVAGLLSDGTTAVTETVAAANASRVATTNVFRQINSVRLSAGSSGNVSVGTNGVATLDVARRVIFTSGGNDTGITFTISGTNWSGVPISETVTGANAGAAPTVLDYLTITKIIASGATATTLTVGTTTIAASPWVMFDPYCFAPAFVQCNVSGTVNYSIETTQDDPNSPTNSVAPSAVTWDTSTSPIVAATATASGVFAAAPLFMRVKLNSGTGSVSATFTQYAGVPA